MGSSKILIIGGTGYIGRHVTKASLAQGHPTFLLVRKSTVFHLEKAELLDSFKSSGANILHGSIEDYASLIAAIKLVDVVISTISTELTAEQFNLIKAIKEAGTIKRFFPSEFGMDVDRTHAVEPIKSYFLPNFVQLDLTTPPRDKVVIYGDGNSKGVYVKEDDIGTYTIKSVDDPRTLNKILYLRLPANTLSFNELVSLWEKKIGKTLVKDYLSEEKVLKLIKETPFPSKIRIASFHSLYVKGDQTNFEIGSDGVEASQLYPDVKYTTVDEYLNSFV